MNVLGDLNMWTRGRDEQNAGKFAYELFGDDSTLLERRGGFNTPYEADRAAEIAQRLALFPPSTRTDDIDTDELMAELLA